MDMAVDKSARYEMAVHIFYRAIALEAWSHINDDAAFDADIDALRRVACKARVFKQKIESHPRGAKEAN